MFDTVSSFLWDTPQLDTMGDNQPIPNKSTLYKLLEKKEETQEENPGLKNNVSSLYKIIANQNLPLKKPEEINEIEYHEVVENSHFEKLNQETIAENALYFVEDEAINTSDAKDLSESEHLNISFSFLDQEMTYDVVDESKISLDLTDKGYLPMDGNNEAIYSSPRSSIAAPSREVSPSYVGPDPKELFYAASEVVSRRPPTPFMSSRDVYEDVELEDRELPPLPVDVEDYCRHREDLPKKLDTLMRGKKLVRSKLNRAWKSVKSIIKEKEFEVKEPETPESPYSCLSENSDYFLKADTFSDTVSETGSRFDPNGLTTLLRRRKDRSGAVSPFRKSRHFVEVSCGM